VSAAFEKVVQKHNLKFFILSQVVIESILNVESNISESDRCSDLQLICAQSEAFRAFHRGSLADLRVSGSGRSLRCEVSKVSDIPSARYTIPDILAS
jgi:hypothetical protein